MAAARRTLLLAALVSAGCPVHRGTAWNQPVPAAAETPTVSLIVIGDAGSPGRTAATVAARLDQVLQDEHARGSEPVVLWLGDNIYPRGPSPNAQGHKCTDPGRAWARKGVAELAAVVRRHIKRGHDSYAVLGDADWSCGHPELELQPNYADGPHPWIMPEFHYVVRVGQSQHVRLASRCEPGPEPKCVLDEDDPELPTLVDLVMVDATPWLAPPPVGTQAAKVAEHSLATLDALLAAIDAEPPESPPRILVTHVPVESAGYRGMGGGKPDATFRSLPRALRDSIQRGRFVGVVSAHDQSLQAAPDLTDAVKRSDKVWLAAPTFQVISGAASRPDGRAAAGGRRIGYFQGITLKPDLFSTHAGFAVMRVSSERVDAILHARRGLAWRTGAVSLPMEREPNPVEGPAPGMAPCLDCDPKAPPQRQ